MDGTTLGSPMIGLIGYGLGAAAFFALAVPLAINWHGRLQGSLLLAACLVSAIWLAGSATYLWIGGLPTELLALLEVLRSLGWIAFLGAMVWWGPAAQGDQSKIRFLIPFGGICLLFIGLVVLRPEALRVYFFTPGMIVGLCLSIVGMVMTETLLRSTRNNNFWYSKFVCIATGLLFTYDLVLYADTALFPGGDTTFLEARGYVQAIAVPTLAVAAIRNRMWRTNLSLSREVVLRSTTLLATGVYLFLMAAVGLVLRDVGTGRGPVLQAVFLVGAAVVLIIVLFSGASRAHLKVLVNKHFFEGKYDWRAEWLRFMNTLAAGRNAASLEARAIKAVADIVESPGGAMWLREGERFEFAAEWNLATAPRVSIADDAPMTQFLDSTDWVVDVESARSQRVGKAGPELPPALLAYQRSWLVVPLRHNRLMGFILLVLPRAPVSLGWEDFDLLKTVGRQTASYLAEQRALKALNEAREFEIFNRRFAFVVHDIKNMASQLSVLCRNFDKHGDKREFREEAKASLHDAEQKIKRLMERIDSVQPEPAEGSGVAIAPLIRQIMAAKRGGEAVLTFDGADDAVLVKGDRERLEAVIAHLVQNAIEAVDGAGEVAIDLECDGGRAIIEIRDNGRGMDEEFLRHELFKPFRTTKLGGMGLGAYQCRQYARELGGSLDVTSRLGEGTTMRVSLPILTAGEAAADLATSSAG